MLVEALERFWKKVDRRGPEECWHWQGARTAAGYGQIANGTIHRGRYRKSLATHVALAIAGHARPSSAHVAMHSCDNPLCVNPAHLRWGTSLENNEDMRRKGRWRPATRSSNTMRGERHVTAKLTIDNVRYIRSSPKSTVALAAELRVTNQCISNVRTGRTWFHVE